MGHSDDNDRVKMHSIPVSPSPARYTGWVGEDTEAALVNWSPTVSSCSASFKASIILD